MSELERERIETEIKNMDNDDLKWLCKQIPSFHLVNEVGQRLMRFEGCATEAKECLEKVV